MRVGSLVWAKLSGHRAWPALVGRSHQRRWKGEWRRDVAAGTEFWVWFVGDDSGAWIAAERVRGWADGALPDDDTDDPPDEDFHDAVRKAEEMWQSRLEDPAPEADVVDAAKTIALRKELEWAHAEIERLEAEIVHVDAALTTGGTRRMGGGTVVAKVPVCLRGCVIAAVDAQDVGVPRVEEQSTVDADSAEFGKLIKRLDDVGDEYARVVDRVVDGRRDVEGDVRGVVKRLEDGLLRVEGVEAECVEAEGAVLRALRDLRAAKPSRADVAMYPGARKLVQTIARLYAGFPEIGDAAKACEEIFREAPSGEADGKSDAVRAPPDAMDVDKDASAARTPCV